MTATDRPDAPAVDAGEEALTERVARAMYREAIRTMPYDVLTLNDYRRLAVAALREARATTDETQGAHRSWCLAADGLPCKCEHPPTFGDLTGITVLPCHCATVHAGRCPTYYGATDETQAAMELEKARRYGYLTPAGQQWAAMRIAALATDRPGYGQRGERA